MAESDYWYDEEAAQRAVDFTADKAYPPLWILEGTGIKRGFHVRFVN